MQKSVIRLGVIFYFIFLFCLGSVFAEETDAQTDIPQKTIIIKTLEKIPYHSFE